LSAFRGRIVDLERLVLNGSLVHHNRLIVVQYMHSRPLACVRVLPGLRRGGNRRRPFRRRGTSAHHQLCLWPA
jgi:hypothetical protein